MPPDTSTAFDAYPPRPARPPVPAVGGTLAGGGQGRGALVPLSELDGVALADGAPDVRGWTVRSAEGRAIGRVDDLLVDTGRMRVRYLAVALEDAGARAAAPRRLLTPVDTARLDDRRAEVLLARGVADIADSPHRTRGRDPR